MYGRLGVLAALVMSGTSVTSSGLPPGDPHCPGGGSSFTSESGTTYACNAPAYVGSAGVLVAGSTISLDGAFGDARWLRAPADAGGPRVKSASIDGANSALLHLVLTAPVLASSVTNAAFTVTTLSGAGGWSAAAISTTTVTVIGADPAIDITLSVALAPPVVVRVVAKGTGPAPIVGTSFLPLAGAAGGNATTADDGADFVAMLALN